MVGSWYTLSPYLVRINSHKSLFDTFAWITCHEKLNVFVGCSHILPYVYVLCLQYNEIS